MTLEGFGARTAEVASLAVLLLLPERAGAQTTVPLPDNNQATTLTAAVPEQARITVPAGFTFIVTNVNATTTQNNVPVAIQNIVLATATKQVRISLMANAASFTPPVAGAVTWSASDVTWTSGAGAGPNAWQNASGASGTLSSAAFASVATCNADATSCSITRLPFSLAAKPTVKRSGNHTLVVTWKIEGIGS